MKITPIRINPHPDNPHPGVLKIRIIRIQTNPVQVGWISNSGIYAKTRHIFGISGSKLVFAQIFTPIRKTLNFNPLNSKGKCINVSGALYLPCPPVGCRKMYLLGKCIMQENVSCRKMYLLGKCIMQENVSCRKMYLSKMYQKNTKDTKYKKDTIS